MADDKKGPEDYEYPPEEYYKGGEHVPDEAEPLEPAGTGRTGFSRRLLFVVGFLLAIGLVYLILSYLGTQRASEVQPTQPIAPITPARPVQQVSVAPPPEPTPAPDAAMQQLMMQNQQNLQTIAALQAQVQQLQGQVSDLTNTITTLNSQIQVISNEVRANAIDRSLQGRRFSLTSNAKVYHLKALVPGRAWLQSPDGATTTVSIGDRLPGYGIIQMINTEQGIVTTSSGGVIQFGPKDS
jgi:intracellular multiplication protein IcmG